MKLSIEERLGLLSVLPKEGNFVTLRIVSDLRRAVAFSEADVKKFSIVQDEGRVMWDASKDKPVDIPIGEKATDIIVEALKKADSQEQLNSSTFALYERFVEGSTNGNKKEA